MSEPIKFCRDCRWYKAFPWYWKGTPRCLHPDANRLDREYLVDEEWWKAASAESTRGPYEWNPCKPEGKLWEPKP